IQVVDDGCGRGPRDALGCFGRHATSKLRSIDDLERLHTLGFRGEALASIAAVAQVELKTKRRQDAAGTLVRVHGGTVEEHRPCAAPDGTSIAVRHLFYNVPARRNFLKSAATEFKHLVETFQFLALSHPRAGFLLTHDGAEVYRTPTQSDLDFEEALRRRVVQLFGEKYNGHLTPVAETTSYLSMRGLVGPPHLARRTHGEQFFFVNGRYVKSRSLSHAVAAAYGEALPSGTFPFFALFLDVDPRHLDVNVHPTKTEVKFDDERGVYSFVRAVAQKALGAALLSPQLDDASARTVSMGAGEREGQGDGEGTPATPASSPTFSGAPRPVQFRGVESGSGNLPARPASGGGASFSAPRPTRLSSGPRLDGREQAARLYGGAVPEGLDPAGLDLPDTPPATPSAPIPSKARPDQLDLISDAALEADTPTGTPPVWQLHGRFLLTPIRTGLLVVDQHAAHQRVLYEQTLATLDGGLAVSQQLLFPQTLDIAAADFPLFEELLPDLRRLGFEISLAAGRTALLHGVPGGISESAVHSLLEDVLEQFKSLRDTLRLAPQDALAKSIARRSAIPAGLRLDEKAARALIDQLFECQQPYADPNGRPTMTKMTLDDLASRFG
ncbi:MAG: DNA mismatch repair endonuclease MutL, partial [Bacteroidota bacterium]